MPWDKYMITISSDNCIEWHRKRKNNCPIHIYTEPREPVSNDIGLIPVVWVTEEELRKKVMPTKEEWDKTIGWDKVCERLANKETK